MCSKICRYLILEEDTALQTTLDAIFAPEQAVRYLAENLDRSKVQNPKQPPFLANLPAHFGVLGENRNLLNKRLH